MAYPEEIIRALQDKYSLSTAKIQQLQNTLLQDKVKSAIENSSLIPENLLIIIDQSSDNFFILSNIAAEMIINKPELLENLKKYISKNLDSMKKWDNIKSDVEKLKTLAASQKNLREKQKLATEISKNCTTLLVFLLENEIITAEFKSLGPLLHQFMNATLEPIYEIAKTHFKTVFEKEEKNIVTFEFGPKRAGVQLGFTMIITYKENSLPSQEKKITYYIKSHQNGSTSQLSSIAPVDPKELFIYKLLEFIGYGPKVHFFYNPLSPGGFYIATQDLGFTKIVNKSKTFELFSAIAEECNNNPESISFTASKKAIISLDIISRILRLKDTTTNPGNFGLIKVNSDWNKWKIIDFRVTDFSDNYLSPQIMEGLKSGNGAYNYEYAKFLGYIFKNVDYQDTRMMLSKQVIEELYHGSKKMAFFDAVDKAYNEIVNYVNDNHDQLNIAQNLDDLTEYARAIRTNFQTLLQGFEIELNLASNSAAKAAEAPPKMTV